MRNVSLLGALLGVEKTVIEQVESGEDAEVMVAQCLSLKPDTVEIYMRTVLTTLDYNNRAEAVVAARRWRLLP